MGRESVIVRTSARTPEDPANGAKVNLANAGLGSASHLCGLMFQSALKTPMTTVPYKGRAPAMTDLIGDQVDLMCERQSTRCRCLKASRSRSTASWSHRDPTSVLRRRSGPFAHGPRRWPLPQGGGDESPAFLSLQPAELRTACPTPAQTEQGHRH